MAANPQYQIDFVNEIEIFILFSLSLMIRLSKEKSYLFSYLLVNAMSNLNFIMNNLNAYINITINL